MKILGNATRAPLGNLHNMQMKVTITDFSFFNSNAVNIQRNGRMVFIPMFFRVCRDHVV